MMSLLSKAKFFVESNVPDVSDISKEDAEKEGKAFSNALGIITDMGINGVDAFLKTDEGKKVSMQIVKHYFQKHWWALAVVAAFNIIEIFATVKFSLSKS